MSLVQRSIRKKPCADSWPAPGTPRSETASSASLPQTRLDRAVTPNLVYFQSYCRWFTRLRDPEEWPSADLKARAEEIGPTIARLERETEEPPVAMTAGEWRAAKDELERLWGQRKAIDDRLSERRRREPRERTRTLRLAGPGSKPSPYDPRQDPFAETEPPDPFALE